LKIFEWGRAIGVRDAFGGFRRDLKRDGDNIAVRLKFGMLKPKRYATVIVVNLTPYSPRPMKGFSCTVQIIYRGLFILVPYRRLEKEIDHTLRIFMLEDDL
jgi:hypothetical protein